MSLTKEQILEALKSNPELRTDVLNESKRKTHPVGVSGDGYGVAIAPKGGISVYGMQRFPTTLYAEQWEALAAFMPDVLKYIADNRAKLKSKPVKEAKKAS